MAKKALTVGSTMVTSRLTEARLPADLSPRGEDAFTAAVYFSSDMSSVYQLDQWLWPFEQLAERLGRDSVAVFVRDAKVALHIRSRTQLPVRFSRLSRGLDTFMEAPSLRLVFYVNQAKGNFPGLRFPRPAHVHLSHGESEKISMISNQLKAYDYVFTAGHAARKRITDNLIGMVEDRMLDVGRPQLDRPRHIPREWERFDAQAPAGPTVFFAPTWEGDSPAMAYGTLPGTGETLVTGLLESGYRVIFRPHPRTGVLDRRFASALERVKGIVTEHPRGFLDSTPEVSWQFDVADVALAEMSSVAFDWLSTHKPLVMIAPDDPGAEVLAGGLFDRCPTVTSETASDIVAITTAAVADDNADANAFEYLGDTAAGNQIRRFIEASAQVIDVRSTELDSRDR
ncbi:CDP-glycerol:poly(glycerophosphate) glycerophosphotransferase [Brevibacterium sanguinis]|uniref:CDP-glycerol:poly(Glycerophosphate) glycerophosphotransferase n=3 Tax=Brevibacteriaceae TaxID=85019 RepID=A0A366IIW5_9MICO|nr:CDP-glycerol:poly(glycerophosphate) glycerophosphotransferase [Brevibacterium sanguinis]RBP72060.1 CDP-glycerol:poly(glycerophosphate) glycerophosphotransferase [Brevibacterium celere]